MSAVTVMEIDCVIVVTAVQMPRSDLIILAMMCLLAVIE